MDGACFDADPNQFDELSPLPAASLPPLMLPLVQISLHAPFTRSCPRYLNSSFLGVKRLYLWRLSLKWVLFSYGMYF